MYLFFNIDISIDLFSTSFQRSELSCFKVRVKNAINHLYIGAVKQKSNLTFVNCHIKSIARFFEIILILINVNQPLHFIDTVSLHRLWKELFDWSILPRTSLFKELFFETFWLQMFLFFIHSGLSLIALLWKGSFRIEILFYQRILHLWPGSIFSSIKLVIMLEDIF